MIHLIIFKAIPFIRILIQVNIAGIIRLPRDAVSRDAASERCDWSVIVHLNCLSLLLIGDVLTLAKCDFLKLRLPQTCPKIAVCMCEEHTICYVWVHLYDCKLLQSTPLRL